jgi:hypothetical protein
MISVVLGLSVSVDCIVIFHVCNFWKSPFCCRYISFGLLLANLVGFFCRTMSAGSPQPRVRQRTYGELAALRAKIMNRSVIAERNVVREILWWPR